MGKNYINNNFRNSKLTGLIIKCSFEVYNVLGYGYPEKIYHRALSEKLIASGCHVLNEQYCKIEIDGKRIGYFYIDMLVDGEVVVELKARDSLLRKDMAQILSYLKANNLNIGLILIFSKSGVQIKRIVY